jgi:hypothetical protein
MKTMEEEKKPKLLAKNAKARLEFAKRHQHWSARTGSVSSGQTTRKLIVFVLMGVHGAGSVMGRGVRSTMSKRLSNMAEDR